MITFNYGCLCTIISKIILILSSWYGCMLFICCEKKHIMDLIVARLGEIRRSMDRRGRLGHVDGRMSFLSKGKVYCSCVSMWDLCSLCAFALLSAYYIGADWWWSASFWKSFPVFFWIPISNKLLFIVFMSLRLNINC